ncbi:MAG: TRAP transporter small permease [Candidatus Puniceispirillum sp.]|nr:TRAP transporter small permease [Candidatus Puniceispirillum sp.]MBT6416820.1 TRAP transporter small permease [Candidatus Puniceispirillum sp.]MBT6566745.1 TRAP transporter small permease [Candidatus Puniceispirillum sp.]
MAPVSWLNKLVIAISKQLAWVALLIMVIMILLQVFFRYVLNDALAWPDEGARLCMLWMTGLMAPFAMRTGGFVAIDMLPRALPNRLAQMLTLFLLSLSAIVLIYAIQFGWKHTMGFGGNFTSSSLKIPLDWIGMDMLRLKLRYVYASLLFGVTFLFTVTIELILRSIIAVIVPHFPLPELTSSDTAGAS